MREIRRDSEIRKGSGKSCSLNHKTAGTSFRKIKVQHEGCFDLVYLTPRSPPHSRRAYGKSRTWKPAQSGRQAQSIPAKQRLRFRGISPEPAPHNELKSKFPPRPLKFPAFLASPSEISISDIFRKNGAVVLISPPFLLCFTLNVRYKEQNQ